MYWQTSFIRRTLGNKIVDHSDVVGAGTFIIDFKTPGFKRLAKGNCKTGRKSFKFWDLVRFIFEIHSSYASHSMTTSTMVWNDRVLFQYAIRRIFVRSREVSKPGSIASFWDWTGTSAALLPRCLSNSEGSYNSKYKSCGFETLRDPIIRLLIGYWNRILDGNHYTFLCAHRCYW